VQDGEKLSLEQIRAFVAGSSEVRFEAKNCDEVYGWVRMLCRYEYLSAGRTTRGLLRLYAEQMTGMSRAQMTRLIGQYRASGEIQVAPYRRHRFASRFTSMLSMR
jgi:hypothetical protein